MNFPGVPIAEPKPERKPDTYHVFFKNDSDVHVEADYVNFDGAWVRFYRKESDTEHILVNAFNERQVIEVRELTPESN